MKKSLLLLLFIPLVSFGQNFDYNDLKVINSETQFKRFSFENEFVKVEEFSNKYKTPEFEVNGKKYKIGFNSGCSYRRFKI